MAAVPRTISEAATAIRAGDITAVALTTAMLERIAADNERLGAFVTVCDETALEAAATADAELAAGVDRGPLQGIPLAIKDIIATKDAPTTANSLVLDRAWGAGIDAPVVARLRAAGAVSIGKSTTMEFACGLPDPDKPFLVPRNPWNVDHTPSGSSSGTGVAILAGMALGGLGTDTGGSVRGPAAANGHTGLKVTFGRVPKNGVVPLGYSLDSIGPMARSALDCALLLQVMAGHHPGDPDAAAAPVGEYAGALTGSVAGLRVGVPTPYFFDSPHLDAEVKAAVLAAIDALAGLGATVVETEVPLAAQAKDANTVTMVAEAFAYHRNDLVSGWTDYGAHTRMQLGRAAFLTAADFAQAQRVRTAFRRRLTRVFADVDVLITPTMLTPAPKAADMRLESTIDMPSFTGLWNLSGLPACATPVGFSSGGLPLSMQVVAKPFDEATTLRVADAYQRITDWHLQAPAVAVSA
jgi:aspartyl-tRNA(Asn)/glutamyl-tRNA(Gln) amidotransferase subunit A